MAGLLDIIQQAASLPTNIAAQKLQYQMMQQQMPILQGLFAQLSGQGQQQPSQGLLAPAGQQPSGSVTSGAPSVPGPAAGAAPTAGTQPGGLLSPQAQPQQPDALSQIMQLMNLGTAYQAFPMTQKIGQAMIDKAKFMAANDPALATRMASAKDAVAVDQQMIQQAIAQNNMPLARAIYNGKLQEDLGLLKVSSMGGIQTRINPDTGVISTLNPSTGIESQGNQAALMPGMEGALQAKAAAEAKGRAQGELTEVTDAQGNKYRVPVSSLLPGSSPASSSAGSSGAAYGGAYGPALAGLGPQTESALEGRGRESQEYVATMQKASDDATTANYALDNVISASRGASVGPGAPVREFVLKQFTALGQSLLGDKFQAPKELASYQELDKYGNQLGFATARTMGSREAAQIVNMAIRSNPNKSLTPQAFVWIANSMKAMNNYIIAKNTAIQGSDQTTPGGAQQSGAKWNANINPQVWDLALDPGMAATLAPKIGAAKIATALPVMSSADAVAAFRNIPASMRPQVLSRLPLAAKQELLMGLQ